MRIARRRWIVLLGTAILGSSLPAITAPTAFATPVCTGSVAARLTYTCAPSGSGSVQVTVPAGVASINVTADGGGGGKNDSLGNGGSGARVNATISVTPGDRLTIYVGAGGGAGLGSSGNVGGSGYGAGGSGGAFYGEGFGGGYGGGGGGSSAVVIGSTVALVAGGGGGGGNYYGGSAAGTIGSSGGNGGGSCAVGGGGGNATGSGSAGTTSGTGNPTSSSSGYTGHGGGGIYGAGGASSGGGGGGGGYGGGGPGNWNGPGYGCTLAGGGGAGGSYAPGGAVYGSASNAGGVATSGAGGDGQVAIQFIAAPATVPGAPTDLIFSDVSPTAMNVFWTPPISDGGSALLGYDVVVGTDAPVRVASAAYGMSGLTSGTTYSVSITAVNSVGSSTTALTGSQQTTTPGVPTGPATNLVFSGVSATSITATWTAPTPVLNWPTLGYQVRVDSGTPVPQGSMRTSYIAAGLTPGVLHSFEITVVNGAGASTALSGSEWTYATAPDAPTNLVFSGVTSSDITASWTAPAYNGGAGITTYWVSVDGGASIAVGNVPSYTATGLTPSTWHSFAITAMNLSGSSPELTGSRSTNAPAGSPRITATSGTVGTASTITLIDFPASSTQTVMITAPDSSMTNVTVTVNGAGSGTGIYTPTSTGSYSAVTSPNATSATFTATSVPTPVPGPASGSSSASGSGSATQAPTIAPASQLIEGTVGAPVDPTATLALAHFTRPATFTIAPTLPAGLALDPLTGVVSGTPVVANASTGYVITANAGSEVATSALRVSIVARSAATASIVITGRAGRGQLAGRIYVTGHATRLAGTVVRVRVRFAGHPTYTDSGTVRVAEDGAFTWQRRARQRAFVYVLDDHGTRSNRVIIAPVR